MRTRITLNTDTFYASYENDFPKKLRRPVKVGKNKRGRLKVLHSPTQKVINFGLHGEY